MGTPIVAASLLDILSQIADFFETIYHVITTLFDTAIDGVTYMASSTTFLTAFSEYLPAFLAACFSVVFLSALIAIVREVI